MNIFYSFRVLYLNFPKVGEEEIFFYTTIDLAKSVCLPISKSFKNLPDSSIIYNIVFLPLYAGDVKKLWNTRMILFQKKNIKFLAKSIFNLLELIIFHTSYCWCYCLKHSDLKLGKRLHFQISMFCVKFCVVAKLVEEINSNECF